MTRRCVGRSRKDVNTKKAWRPVDDRAPSDRIIYGGSFIAWAAKPTLMILLTSVGLLCGCEASRNGIPIDDVPERGDVVGTAVLVVQVVGVFPHVEA